MLTTKKSYISSIYGQIHSSISRRSYLIVREKAPVNRWDISLVFAELDFDAHLVLSSAAQPLRNQLTDNRIIITSPLIDNISLRFVIWISLNNAQREIMCCNDNLFSAICNFLSFFPWIFLPSFVVCIILHHHRLEQWRRQKLLAIIILHLDRRTYLLLYGRPTHSDTIALLL